MHSHKTKQLFFGPLIGIFTTGFNDDSSTPLGNRSIALSELLTPPFSLRPFVFVFGVQHIHWEEETIEGYFFQEKQWIKKKSPFTKCHLRSLTESASGKL